MTYKNDRFIRALLKEPVDRTPVWMMRQAGRYLPEYRAVRAKAGDFMSLCRNAEFACEVTLQPIDRFGFDAAILFSDILTIPDAMGLELSFVSGKGPVFAKPIESVADIEALPKIDVNDELGYVMNAVSTIRKALKNEVPLIGFTGSPWTLATYMIEGGSSKDFGKVRGFMYEHPEAMHLLLDKLADVVIDYLNAQIQSGAAAVQIFDTWGGILSKQHYQAFSLRYMQKIINGLIKEYDGAPIPSIVFTKNGGMWLKEQAVIGANGLGLDWMTDISEAKAQVGQQVVLQGNMDPGVLYSTPKVVREHVGQVLAGFGQVGKNEGHIFNLGHGIHPGIDPENVKAMVEAVHELSPQYHTLGQQKG